jgi:choline dehydrogenase-like flavoprotein
VTRLSDGERVIALALAEAVLPPGRVFPGAGPKTVDRYEKIMSHAHPAGVHAFRAMLRTLELGAVASRGRRFSALARDDRERLLDEWRAGALPRRLLVGALVTPLKAVHFDDPDIYGAMGCVYDHRARSAEAFAPAARATRAADLSDRDAVECDVAVVGTGAGGAVVAKELAERGLAVALLEEGEYHTRADVTGRSLDGSRKFYRDRGMTFTVGNTIIPIPLGRTVGGSTAINTGTCWRTPPRILAKWRDQCGLTDFTVDHMAPYFERVEAILEVEPARAEYLGGAARVIARGCDRLGYHHLPVRRNAPSCDGSGVCDFGCPTDARRSTNVSYVPLALRAGAQLITGLRAERVRLSGGRATGIDATALATRKRVTVRARAVVLSCGALLTPALLLRQGIANRSGRLGKNLSIHPASAVSARFSESIRGFAAIPQGYCVDHFHDDGLLFLGASAPLDIGANLFPFVGRRLMDVMEAYDQVASFGVMVEDQARGRVRVGPGGRPLASYWLGDHEIAQLQRGIEIVARIFLAAGAREVYPRVDGWDALRNEADLGHFHRARLGARDFLLTAFHPLGTCAMGPDPRSSVIDPSHQAHDVPGLYVVDGSAVPTSVAVNPQVTIMALATRAAERIAHALA